MNTTLFHRLLIMFVSPVIAVKGIFHERSFVYKRWVFTLFITFYGSNIFLTESNDGFVHLSKVYAHYLDLAFDDFLYQLYHILIFSPTVETNDDVFIHIISFLVGSVLHAPQLFFVVVSFVYAYFFSGTMLKVLEGMPEFRHAKLLYWFAIVFFLWKNIEGINTVRTWTGLWVLTYGLLTYLETKKGKYLLLMMTAPLIHVAYLVMALPALVVVVFGNRKLLYIIIFTFSFFTTFLEPQQVVSELEQTELGKAKVKGYYIESTDELFKKKDPSTGTWYYYLMRVGLQESSIDLLAFTLILFGIYNVKMNGTEQSMFSAGILTLSLANSSWFLFALENRSSIIGATFILIAVLLFLKRGGLSDPNLRSNRLLKLFLLASAAMLIPYVIYKCADLIRYISVFFLLFPFIPWINQEWNVSIREGIGMLFEGS